MLDTKWTVLDSVVHRSLRSKREAFVPGNIRRENWIGPGSGLGTIQVDGEVYKLYCSELLDQLRLYQEIVIQTKALVEKPHSLSLAVDPQMKYRVSINPVNQVMVAKAFGIIGSKSNFVFGKTLPEAEIMDGNLVQRFLAGFNTIVSSELNVSGLCLDENDIRVYRGLLVVTSMCADLAALRQIK